MVDLHVISSEIDEFKVECWPSCAVHTARGRSVYVIMRPGVCGIDPGMSLRD